METLGLIIIVGLTGLFAIASSECVANDKGQSLFDKSKIKYKDGDNT
jgi:hypothetical protein